MSPCQEVKNFFVSLNERNTIFFLPFYIEQIYLICNIRSPFFHSIAVNNDRGHKEEPLSFFVFCRGIPQLTWPGGRISWKSSLKCQARTSAIKKKKLVKWTFYFRSFWSEDGECSVLVFFMCCLTGVTDAEIFWNKENTLIELVN